MSVATFVYNDVKSSMLTIAQPRTPFDAPAALPSSSEQLCRRPPREYYDLQYMFEEKVMRLVQEVLLPGRATSFLKSLCI